MAGDERGSVGGLVAAADRDDGELAAGVGGERSIAGASWLQTSHHGAQNHSSVGVLAAASSESAKSPPPSSRATDRSGTAGPGESASPV